MNEPHAVTVVSVRVPLPIVRCSLTVSVHGPFGINTSTVVVVVYVWPFRSQVNDPHAVTVVSVSVPLPMVRCNLTVSVHTPFGISTSSVVLAVYV
jgi:hypothetical protein